METGRVETGQVETSDRTDAAEGADDPGPGGILALLGWAGRTDVERVRRYTVWSLRVLLWVLVLAYASSALVGSASESSVAVLTGVVTFVVLGAFGDVSVRLAISRWPGRGTPWREWPVQLLLLAAGSAASWVALAPGAADAGALYAVATVVAFALGGFRSPWLHRAVVLGAFLLLWLVADSVTGGLVAAGFAAFLVFTMQSSLWLLGVVEQLDRARRAEAELAVAQERLRFSSDVHDVMGRHLSTIAVQAELAAALVTKGDDRALERIQQVRTTAHDALREARELARGYRPVDLAREVEGAVALLTSAGVLVEGEGGRLSDALVADLPASWHEPVAKVVREAVTNVLRHSRATWVRAAWDGRVLTISNDGAAASGATASGVTATQDDGSGLATLTADLGERGATVSHALEGDVFTLAVELTTPTPASTATATSAESR